METRMKFPRTAHLPWSPGATADDIILPTATKFADMPVVVTEKMDGENTTIYPDGTCHARSLDSKAHPSRTWVKRLAARVGPQLPLGFRVCGENLFARHSIAYTNLPGYFLMFAICDGETVLSWEDTVTYAALLNLPLVPVLYRGPGLPEILRACSTKGGTYGVQEGYVVRPESAFSILDYGTQVAKYVRAGHVQTDSHWMHTAVVPNTLNPSNSE